MKRFIPAIIIIVIIIASAAYSYFGRGICGVETVNTDSIDSIKRIPVDNMLRMRVDSFVAAEPHVGSLGIAMYDISADKVLYTYNPDSLMRPASCMKLLTCAAMLHYFKPDFKYHTRLYSCGRMVNDTLVGDIVLRANFDPCFDRDTLNALVGQLPARGIKALRGRVVLDAAFAEEMKHEEHWIIGDLHLRTVGLVYNGAERFRRELAAAVRGAGIAVPDSAVVLGQLPQQGATLLADDTTSLGLIIESSLKYSSNARAESMLYPLGYLQDAGSDYRSNGIKMLHRFVAEEVDSTAHLSIHDGCGLCPGDLMSASFIVKLLTYIYRHPQMYDVVYQRLPNAGIDGTLWDRMRKPNVVGMLRGKTGTMTREGGISTLSGYFVNPADGHVIAYSILNNQCPVYDGRQWQDRFFERAVFPVSLMRKEEEQPAASPSAKDSSAAANQAADDKAVAVPAASQVSQKAGQASGKTVAKKATRKRHARKSRKRRKSAH